MGPENSPRPPPPRRNPVPFVLGFSPPLFWVFSRSPALGPPFPWIQRNWAEIFNPGFAFTALPKFFLIARPGPPLLFFPNCPVGRYFFFSQFAIGDPNCPQDCPEILLTSRFSPAGFLGPVVGLVYRGGPGSWSLQALRPQPQQTPECLFPPPFPRCNRVRPAPRPPIAAPPPADSPFRGPRFSGSPWNNFFFPRKQSPPTMSPAVPFPRDRPPEPPTGRPPPVPGVQGPAPLM